MTGRSIRTLHRKTRLRVGVLVSGRGSNLGAILKAIRRGRLRAEVAVVISDRPEAPALSLARIWGCPTVTLDPKSAPNREQFDQTVAGTLKQHGVELVVLAGYMRIITPALIEPYRDRIINIHPALLPSFPGLKAQQQAVDAGVKLAGCTVHFVTEEVDRGPIIIQAAVPVRPGEREASLARRLLEQEHRIVPRAIELYAQGRLRVQGRTVAVKGLREIKQTALINPPLTG
ncbi:MAG TPA: phosphoribosylglycinamide formyltransferase [Nitrospiria bacterium]|nr:phosphoribosylglycinamide formyltransferase [Nitrospiria bacterium]